ncbi:hypothetical protein LGM58_02230 [Burkholderia contaminans]|uniref:hypothetical protein n=1 Tax=Burkholderia contaminans TaxID=488447 RepID=UPI001CF13657|nr:hypothetical protein [Burkholderia contaminans]MCA7881995.1 hypothetical protein [Burkholderia contaminans]HEM7878105.1 hypothetical protein [Burkholderia contaminans]
MNSGSCISSIPRIDSSARGHERDISNAPLAKPVYTVPKFNSLLGMLGSLYQTAPHSVSRLEHRFPRIEHEMAAGDTGIKKKIFFYISSHEFYQKMMFATSNTKAHLRVKKYTDNIFAHIHPV